MSTKCVVLGFVLLMEEIWLTTWDVKKHVVNNRINYLSTGAGFLPSTVLGFAFVFAFECALPSKKLD